MGIPLAWPDLGAPPAGWTGGRVGPVMRLVPPGAFLDRSRAFIAVSPIVPRTDAMPPPAALIAQALALETRQTGAVPVDRAEPAPFATDGGLEGVRVEVTLRTRAGGTERRAYVMVQDAARVYALTYVADEATWPSFLADFDRAARSLRPPGPTAEA